MVVGIVLWSLVVALHFIARPPDIARSIRTIIIDAVKSETGWAFSNISEVGQEGCKAVPAFANFDAARPVPSIICVVWVSATLPHVFPCAVERMRLLSCRVTVTKPSSVTSARGGVAGLKIADINNTVISTITTTNPKCISVNVFAEWFDSNQSTISYACYIQSRGHRTAPIGSRSSDEVDVQAPTSLRILAPTVRES